MMAGVATSTETRELAVAPVRERLLALIAARRPADAAALRAFATAYLRRLSADAAAVHAARGALGEVAGAFDFAAAPRRPPDRRPRVQPDARRSTATSARARVLETNTEDLPFLVDSVRAELEAARRTGDRRACCTRSSGWSASHDGRITGVLHPREATARESVMHFELDRRLDADAARRRSPSRAAVGARRRPPRRARLPGDGRPRPAHGPARQRRRSPATPTTRSTRPSPSSSGCCQDHFIFLGYREYRIAEDDLGVVPGSGLGILADEASSAYARPRPLADLPDDVRERALEGDLLIVSKTNRLSPVHRRARMDYVGVRKIAPDGRRHGRGADARPVHAKAYAEPASQTPLLNRKLRQILRHEDLIEGSHDYKAAVALFDSFPKDELFSAPRRRPAARGRRAALARGRPRAAARPPLGRTAARSR